MKTRNATYATPTTITNHKTTIQEKKKMETNTEKDHDVDDVEEKCVTSSADVVG